MYDIKYASQDIKDEVMGVGVIAWEDHPDEVLRIPFLEWIRELAEDAPRERQALSTNYEDYLDKLRGLS